MVLKFSFRKIHQKYLKSFETWYCRMHEIVWTDRVGHKEVLHGFDGGSNVLLRIRMKKANWIGHILHVNCLLKQHFIEGSI